MELKSGLVFRHKVNKEMMKVVTVGIELRGTMTNLYPSTTCYLCLSLKDNIMSVRREQDFALESTSWEEVKGSSAEFTDDIVCRECVALREQLNSLCDLEHKAQIRIRELERWIAHNTTHLTMRLERVHSFESELKQEREKNIKLRKWCDELKRRNAKLKQESKLTPLLESLDA